MTTTDTPTQLRADARTEAIVPFWPPWDVHHVTQGSATRSLPSKVASVSSGVRQLAALADAARALQTLDARFIHHDGAAALLAASAETLAAIAEADIVSSESREIMRLRAEALSRGSGYEQAAVREAELTTSQPLTVICGPMCTWRLKSRRPLHSLIASVGHAEGSCLVETIDRALEPALTVMRHDLGIAELSARPACAMVVDDLMACGGEANAFPKHFAYFLPEDEGVQGADSNKTLVFANVYQERYDLISAPLGRALLDPEPLPQGAGAVQILLAWFRGHDIGHSVELPETSYDRWAKPLGHERFMMLQETLADVYGFLLALTPEWRQAGGYSTEGLCGVFLAEMLHYLRRGPWLYGDAGAAYLELSYLIQHRYVSLAPGGERIRWEPEALCDGMQALAGTLARELLAARDSSEPAGFIQQYGWEGRNFDAHSVVGALRRALGHVPTALAYGRGES